MILLRLERTMSSRLKSVGHESLMVLNLAFNKGGQHSNRRLGEGSGPRIRVEIG